MLDTEVRGPDGRAVGEVEDLVVGRDGRMQAVVVGLRGPLDVGDRRLAVAWNQVQVGPRMALQAPVTPQGSGRYSASGQDAEPASEPWRVTELIGDYVNLEDAPRYGRVSDVIFGAGGEARAVLVERNPAWGSHGPFPHSFYGYGLAFGAYTLPYASSDVTSVVPFDYDLLKSLQRKDSR